MTARVWAMCDLCGLSSDDRPNTDILATSVDVVRPTGEEDRLVALCAECHALPVSLIQARYTRSWRDANAHLIAAAPKMLAALLRLTEEALTPTTYAEMMSDARAAIRAARGEG